MNNKLLVISHRFPPIASPEAIVAIKTVKALVEFGWDVTLITVDTNSWVGSVDYQLADHYKFMKLEVIRVRTILSIFNRIKKTSLRNRIFSAFKKVLSFLGIIEPEFLWVLPALTAARKVIIDKQINAIYSRSFCISSNIVGLMVKKEFNLPWIAHFSDPWVDNSFLNLNRFQMEKLKKLEFDVICSADGLEFTSDETISLVMKKYDKYLLERAFYSYHGFDRDVEKLIKTDEAKADNKLILSYTGSFYGKRSPESLFHALASMERSDLEKIEINLIGPSMERFTSILEKLNLCDIVKLVPSKSYFQSLVIAANADILLVIDAPADNQDSIFFPSKLSDYLLLSKPIVGLTPLQGVSAKLIYSLDGDVVDPLNVERIKDLLCRLVNLWEQKKIGISDNYKTTRDRYCLMETNKILHENLAKMVFHINHTVTEY